MKKVIIVISCFFASTMICKSQFFIGGSFNISSQSGKTESNGNENKVASSFSLSLSPQVGYRISDKIDLGAYLSYGYSHTNSNGDPEMISNESILGFGPFMRYYFFTLNKFSVYGEATGLCNFSVTKSKTGDIENDDVKNITLGLVAYPGMSYKLNDKIELMAGISLFSLGLTHNIQKIGDLKEINQGFHFGVDMTGILNTGSISIGAIFRL